MRGHLEQRPARARSSQLRSLVLAARSRVRQWLGVAVPRELNVAADSLSHPARYEEVRAAAEAAGWSVLRVRAPEHCWAALRSAMQLPMGGEAAGWRERGELAFSTTGQ